MSSEPTDVLIGAYLWRGLFTHIGGGILPRAVIDSS
jgi:hypothetical protein